MVWLKSALFFRF